MIGHDWREFGVLPEYEVGLWHEDLGYTSFLRNRSAGGKLPFDPKHYPPKPKKRITKQLRPKSTKPRFSKDTGDDNYHPSGESEREEW
jgi:hypothetical protein